jgi:hypothetical protein
LSRIAYWLGHKSLWIPLCRPSLGKTSRWMGCFVSCDQSNEFASSFLARKEPVHEAWLSRIYIALSWNAICHYSYHPVTGDEVWYVSNLRFVPWCIWWHIEPLDGITELHTCKTIQRRLYWGCSEEILFSGRNRATPHVSLMHCNSWGRMIGIGVHWSGDAFMAVGWLTRT